MNFMCGQFVSHKLGCLPLRVRIDLFKDNPGTVDAIHVREMHDDIYIDGEMTDCYKLLVFWLEDNGITAYDCLFATLSEVSIDDQEEAQ